MREQILLVEPDYPIPAKSKNHANFLPIGLLKIGTYHKNNGDIVKLVRGNREKTEIDLIRPDRILITSLFTYWSSYVAQTVSHYRHLFPKAQIEVGGIFASLMPRICRSLTGCDLVKKGLYLNGKAENVIPDYSLLPEEIDYQIIHASRGCFRRCSFCGTWKIEKNVTYKQSIQNEVFKNKVVFYDNNILANPHIKNILEELRDLRIHGRPVLCESQSGLDGRLLLKNPELARLLKKARFKNVKIAWDGRLSSKHEIAAQINILKSAGYKTNADVDISVFMLFNSKISYEEMVAKLEQCRKWGVIINDCRYRPLNSLYDNYKPRSKHQTSDEYFISDNWTDEQIRKFRRMVRRQNIAIMLGLPQNRYIEGVERGYVATN